MTNMVSVLVEDNFFLIKGIYSTIVATVSSNINSFVKFLAYDYSKIIILRHNFA